MNGLALCAGAGGLELGIAIAVPKYRCIAAVENDPHAAALLRKRHPEAAIFRDVVGFDGRPLVGCVDIVTAGFPCQPHSVAGKPATNGTECSFWHTVTSRDQKNPNEPGSGNFQRKLAAGFTIDLSDVAAMWQTPSARDWKDGRASQETLDRNARPLNEAATYWLTPHGMAGTDYTGKTGAGGEFAQQATRWQLSHPAPPPVSGPEFWQRVPILLRLCRLLKKRLPSPYRKVSTLFRRKLNPDFVDWLMGWPVGWSSEDRDFSAAEMASWLCRQRSLMRRCGGE